MELIPFSYSDVRSCVLALRKAVRPSLFVFRYLFSINRKDDCQLAIS